MEIFHLGAVDPELPNLFGQIRILGCNQPPLAQSSKVLGWKKGKTTQGPHGTRHSALILRPQRLSGILDDRNIFLFGCRQNRPHVCTLAKEMNCNYCSGFWTNLGCHLIHSHIVATFGTIYKNRPSTQSSNGPSSGKKCVGGTDNLISGTYPQRLESQKKSI